MDDVQKVKVLDMIAEDARDDAAYYEGKPFTGRNVAEYFGKQGASISSLAKIMKEIILDKTVKRNDAEEAKQEAKPEERIGEPSEKVEYTKCDDRTGTPFSRTGISRAKAGP